MPHNNVLNVNFALHEKFTSVRLAKTACVLTIDLFVTTDFYLKRGLRQYTTKMVDPEHFHIHTCRIHIYMCRNVEMLWIPTKAPIQPQQIKSCEKIWR